MNIVFREQERYREICAVMFQGDAPLYVGGILQRSMRLYPESIALIFKDQRYTYKKLGDWAARCAYVMQEQKIGKKSLVLICLSNCPSYYAAYFGAWQRGAVVAPLNTFLGPYELSHIISDAQPSLIVTEQSRVQQFRQAGYGGIIMTEDEIEQMQHNASTADHCVDLDLDDLCALLYTSGTTGAPKGVMLSSRAIMTNIAQIIARLDMTVVSHEIIAGILPLFHVFAQNTCMWAPLFLGATIVLAPRIDRSAIVEVLVHKPTLFVGVPALFGLYV